MWRLPEIDTLLFLFLLFLLFSATASLVKMRGVWSSTAADSDAATASNGCPSQASNDRQGMRGGAIPLVCVCVRSGWRGG